jgi:hypothetical protein
MNTIEIISNETSVVVLQRLWIEKFKSLTTYNIIKKYFSKGLAIKDIISMEIDQLVDFLRIPSVITISKECLHRIYLLCISRHNFPNELKNINIFLIGYIIAFYPTVIFNNMTNLESKLIKITSQLLITFEKICEIIYTSDKHLFQDVPYELTKDFLSILFEYFKCYNEWKSFDKNIIIYRIKDTLISLYQADKKISKNYNLKIELETQIIKLRNKLEQIAGVNVLNEFDKQHSELVIGRLTHEQLLHELMLNPSFKM